MHRYFPRFHVIQADSPYTVRWGPFQTFSFPETSFTSVTAYQNPKVQTDLRKTHKYLSKSATGRSEKKETKSNNEFFILFS